MTLCLKWIKSIPSSKFNLAALFFQIEFNTGHTAINHRNWKGLRKQSCSAIPSSIFDFMGETLISYNLGHSFPVTAIKNISHINFMGKKPAFILQFQIFVEQIVKNKKKYVFTIEIFKNKMKTRSNYANEK